MIFSRSARKFPQVVLLKFKTVGMAASLVISALCIVQTLLAGELGPFRYTENANSITIDLYRSFGADGNVVVPATINGKPVTAIGDGAFGTDSTPTGISMPPTVTRIGKRAFVNCHRLENIVIPSGVTTIENSTFAQCSALKSVTMPAGLTHIGAKAFTQCDSLENIVIPSNVKTLGHFAFTSTGIRTIKIPSTVAQLGRGLFGNCRELRDADLPANLTEIPIRMFAGCSKLTRIKIPPTVNRIGEGAFENSGLNTIDLGTVARIESAAFKQCKGLTMVTLPQSVREIEKHAFDGCDNLASAFFLGKAPIMGNGVFRGVSEDFKVFIDAGAKGYTVPRWEGYRASLPTEEIAVSEDDGSSLSSGETSIRLGAVIVGRKGDAKRFTIRNVGARKLARIQAKMKGGDSSEFVVKMPSKSSLAPGKTATLEVVFEPKNKGKRTSQLQILSSDDNENPFVIELSGGGLQLVD